MTNPKTCALSDQGIHVFTYGSLMYGDIFEEVTGCLPERVCARAYGWQRFGLIDLAYPGACPVNEQERFIEGMLWLNVSQTALDALDRFEGDQYRRVQIKAALDGQAPCQAFIYEWLLPELTRGQWDPEAFEREHRHNFAQIHGARQD